MNPECPQCGAPMRPGSPVCAECGAEQHIVETLDLARLGLSALGLSEADKRRELAIHRDQDLFRRWQASGQPIAAWIAAHRALIDQRATGRELAVVDWASMTGLGESRQGALIIRTWADPCPVCGGQLTALQADAIIVKDNPGAVLSLPNPACAFDPEDPDSPDCICTTLINPAPDPLDDVFHVAGYVFTVEPCGHRTEQKIRLYRQVLPAPGTLGALIADWAALGEDTP